MEATTKISFDREVEEYRVRLFIDGIYQAGGDYFTDDKEDAEVTAEFMKNNASPTDKTTDFAIAEQQDYDNENGWVSSDLKNAVYIGTIEFQDNKEEFHVFEIYRTQNHIVFGSFCNVGFLESGFMPIDSAFSFDMNLQELLADLEVYYNDGKEYTNVIVCNQRM